jgi:hypothetical protein
MTNNYYNHNIFYSNNEITAIKNFGNWTPNKKDNHQNQMNSNSTIGNDSTLVNSNIEFLNDESIGTPENKTTSRKDKSKQSIRTPIKKSKRRECTPHSPGEEHFDKKNDTIFQFMGKNQNFKFGIAAENKNFLNNHNLLKINPNFARETNINNTFQFSKLSKSKFLDKINLEKLLEINYDDEKIDTNEILEKIRGSYLLSLIESDINMSLSKSLFKNIVDDSELFNKITNLICYCIIDGFNYRTDIFFKLLVFLFIKFRQNQFI